ncbi:MAG: hypothetical protein K9N21_00310 [Deltaproteobacteria bacterium]|nr:hypothetical protein [Deltaproteobacteria bacterium]
MDSEFKILTHVNGDYLHLKLIGKFNGVSARQLIDLLWRYVRNVSTVIIHTSSLVKDIQFAQDEFRDDLLFLRKQPVRFIVTGEFASLFS